jgi:competence protein ComEC
MSPLAETSAAPDVEIHFLDVGQGDSTLIVDHGERLATLVDCHREGEEAVENLVQTTGAELGAAIITHFHVDHFEAIPNIVRRHPHVAVYCNHSIVRPSRQDARAKARAFKRWLAGEKLSGRERHELREGAGGTVGRLTWTCLAPTVALLDSAEGYAEENRASVVLRLELPKLSILLGADADAIVWEHVLAVHPGAVDILRVPHHGGPLLPVGRLSPKDLIDVLAPTHSVVSVGSINRYGHADRDWLTSAARSGRVMCTQVTTACHGRLNTSTACAHHVTVQWWRDGTWRVLPEASAHLEVVNGWDHPCCLRDQGTRGAVARVDGG